MKIRIIESSNPGWYSDKIGETFDVYDSGDTWNLWEDMGLSIQRFVRKEDAEIIKDPLETTQLDQTKKENPLDLKDAIKIYRIKPLPGTPSTEAVVEEIKRIARLINGS